MKNHQNLRTKLSLLTVVLDYIHSRDWKDHERFGAFLVEKLVSRASPDQDSINKIINGLSHPFFRYNRIDARVFATGFPTQSVLNIMRSQLEVERTSQGRVVTRMSNKRLVAKRLYLEDIDSFSEMQNIPRTSVTTMVPLNTSERSIKNLLCDILGVNPIPEDWGGERSDLFAHVVFRRRRMPAAFLLKGNGTRGQLTIAKCGKNGDQIVRLVQEPAQLFIVQHVNTIDTNVWKALEMAANSVVSNDKQVYYCLADGVETARLFKAYATLTQKLTC